MSDEQLESFKDVRGRKVVSRQSAEHLGTVTHLLVDPERRAVSHLVVGKRRNARVIDWDQVTGFGSDAVLVAVDEAAREARGMREQAAVRGELELLGRRVLSEFGTELGKVDDVSFDPATGILSTLAVGSDSRPAADLLGAGSYAVVLRG
jgi:sporulation protein YlmC with PRC-barrel domain